MSAPAANHSSPPAITMQRDLGVLVPALAAVRQLLHQLGRERVARVGAVEPGEADGPARLGGDGGHRHGTSALMPGHGAADDQLLDLGRALVERRHAGVAQVALDRVVVDVARAAVHLDRRVRRSSRPPRWRTAWRSTSRWCSACPGPSASRRARRARAPPRSARPCRRSSPARAGRRRSGGRTACAPWSRRPTRRASPGRCPRSRRPRCSGPSRARDIAILKPSPISPISASSRHLDAVEGQLGRVGALQAELAVDLLDGEARRLSVGTRKQARPLCFFSGSVWAKIIASFA